MTQQIKLSFGIEVGNLELAKQDLKKARLHKYLVKEEVVTVTTELNESMSINTMDFEVDSIKQMTIILKKIFKDQTLDLSIYPIKLNGII